MNLMTILSFCWWHLCLLAPWCRDVLFIFGILALYPFAILHDWCFTKLESQGFGSRFSIAISFAVQCFVIISFLMILLLYYGWVSFGNQFDDKSLPLSFSINVDDSFYSIIFNSALCSYIIWLNILFLMMRAFQFIISILSLVIAILHICSRSILCISACFLASIFLAYRQRLSAYANSWTFASD